MSNAGSDEWVDIYSGKQPIFYNNWKVGQPAKKHKNKKNAKNNAIFDSADKGYWRTAHKTARHNTVCIYCKC